MHNLTTYLCDAQMSEQGAWPRTMAQWSVLGRVSVLGAWSLGRWRRALAAQGTFRLPHLLKPLGESWPMYNGDYSGRRFSPLTKIDTSNGLVADAGLGLPARIPATRRQAAAARRSVTIKGTPVVVNGVLYVTIPDHVWAVDARSGREIWHATWPSKGGWHIGNRGVAVLGSTVYVETPDCNLVALDMPRRPREVAHRDLRSRAVLLRLRRSADRQATTSSSASAATTSTFPATRSARSGNRRAAVALVRLSRAGHAGSEDVAERRSDDARRRHDVGLHHLRSGAQSDLLRHRQPAAGDQRAQAAGRQPLHRVDRRAQSRHGKAGVVLPVVAARHARLGRHADAGALRRRDRRASRASCWRRRAATAGSSCSTARTAGTSCSTRVHQDELDEGPRREGPADSRSREGAADRRRARLAESGWRAELAAAELQPAHRPLLRQRHARLQRVLPLRERRRREAAGVGRQRSRRMVGGDAAGDRLQDRQRSPGATNGPAAARRPLGPAEHGGQCAVCRRRAVELRRLRCGKGTCRSGTPACTRR